MLIRRTASVAAVVMVEAGALVLLHRLGSYGPAAIEWGNLGRWLADTPPEDVLVGLVRVAALVLAWWLVASTALYVLARMTRVPSLVRAVEWTTLPAVRRLIDGVAATTVAAGSVLRGSGVAAAAPADHTAVVVQLGAEVTSAKTAPRYRPRPAGSVDAVEPVPAPTAAAGTTVPPARAATPTALVAGGDGSSSTSSPSGATGDAAGYVVQPGDNLWRIAERHLKGALGGQRRISPQPKSGATGFASSITTATICVPDSNLIYPGEHLTLPPPV